MKNCLNRDLANTDFFAINRYFDENQIMSEKCLNQEVAIFHWFHRDPPSQARMAVLNTVMFLFFLWFHPILEPFFSDLRRAALLPLRSCRKWSPATAVSHHARVLNLRMSCHKEGYHPRQIMMITAMAPSKLDAWSLADQGPCQEPIYEFLGGVMEVF